MKNKNKNLVFIFILLFTTGFLNLKKCWAEEQLLISEILINGTDGQEFIELYNPSANDIELKNHYWSYYSSKRNWDNPYRNKKFPDEAKIKSHGFYWTKITGDDFPELISDWNWGYSSHQLSNSDGSLAIFPDDNWMEENCLDWVAWGDVEYVGQGKELKVPSNTFSLERIDNSSSQWQESCVLNGTHGQENSNCEEEEEEEEDKKDYSNLIKINEIYPAPNTKKGEMEFVEIINESDENIDFLNWCVKDEVKQNKTSWSCKNPSRLEQKDKYCVLYGNFSLNNDKDGDAVYLYDENKNLIGSVSYQNPKSYYSYSLDEKKWKWTSRATPREENKFDKTVSKKSIRIISLSPNPVGKDSENEWIEIQNRSKDKINLKNWSVATGWDKLYNHPIREDFKIKAGKTKKLSREICAFTLNNEKTKIELRSPDGKTIYKIKYNRKKNKIEEGEIYEKKTSGWEWNMENTENKKINENFPILLAGENSQKPVEEINENAIKNISNIVSEETRSNIGKYSLNSGQQSAGENREKFLNHNSNIRIPATISKNQSRVLGAEKIKIEENHYSFTPVILKKHWAVGLFENFFIKINFSLNRFLNK